MLISTQTPAYRMLTKSPEPLLRVFIARVKHVGFSLGLVEFRVQGCF